MSLLLLVLLALPARAGTVAGGVVSSTEWKVKRGANTEEEFIGNVRYRSGPTIFSSDWALYKHVDQSWRTKGRVKVEHFMDDGSSLLAQGDEAVFDQRTQKGSMTAKDGVSFTRTPRGEEPDRGHADKVEWSGRDLVSALGGVRTWGPRLETWSDRADYSRERGQLLLTGGRPVLLKLEGFDESSSDWIGALQGDKVTAIQNPRTLIADGKAKGWLEFKQVKGNIPRGEK